MPVAREAFRIGRSVRVYRAITFPTFLFFLVVGFVSVNGGALGASVWLLRDRGHHSDWAISLLLTTIGSLAGPLLLCDLGVRVIASQFFDTVNMLPPSTLTLWLCWLWTTFASPILFVLGFFHRATATPFAVYFLQASQLVAWLWSGVMLLIVSIQF
jgi:hypothetical protein